MGKNDPAIIHFWKKKKKREMGGFIQMSMFSRITGLVNFKTVISMLVGLWKKRQTNVTNENRFL